MESKKSTTTTATTTLIEKNGGCAQRKKRSTEIVAIHGAAGVGKSTLVRNIQQVAREYGYVAIAKFDRRSPMPYGCILRCMSIFFKNILSELPSEVDRFSAMLKEQLGPQAVSQLPTLLLDNVPEIKIFLGNPQASKECESDMGGSEIKTRFHSAFTEIFQVMVRFRFVTLVSSVVCVTQEEAIEIFFF